MRKSLWILASLFAVSFAQPAFADGMYTINFNSVSGPAVTGSFTYSNGVFSNFDATWEGITFSFTSQANSVSPLATIPGCSAPGLFAYLTENGCGSGDAWFVFSEIGGKHFTFESGTDGSTVMHADLFGNPLLIAGSFGSFTVTPVTATREPPSIYLMLAGLGLVSVVWKRTAQRRDPA